MAPRRKARQEEEELPYTTEELEEYVNFVCDNTDEVKDYPSKYGIQFGANVWSYIDAFIRTLKMKITPTKYLDEQCMEVLGIRDDVLELFGNIGWIEFLNIKKPTYRELTMEVLSTIRMELDKNNAPAGISFRLGNQDRHLSARELNHIFGTPEDNGTAYHLGLSNFDCQEMWVMLARKDSDDEPVFDPSHSKASRIRNPVFRYVQRVLANTVFARGEIGAVRREELFLIHCMISRIPVNMAPYLMNQLYRQCTATVFKCQIGGLITHIADYFGSTHHLQFPPVAGDMLLDLKALRRMKFVEKINDVYCLFFEGEALFPLPNTELTTWRGETRGNWDLSSEAHDNWRMAFHEMRVQQEGRQETVERRQRARGGERARVRPFLQGESSRGQILLGGESSGSEEIPNEEPSRLDTRPPIHSTYERRDSDIMRFTRSIEGLTTRMDGFTTQLTGLAAAQAQMVERQIQTEDHLQELLNRQRIMFDWHVSEGHFPPYHPPQ